jgi:hypothetical protein
MTALSSQKVMLKGAISATRTIAENESRSGDIVVGTLLAKVGSSDKYVPWTDATATDGSQRPCAILGELVTEAQNQGGDVTRIVYEGGVADSRLITIENSLTLATVVTVPTNAALVARDCLRMFGIIIQTTADAVANS